MDELLIDGQVFVPTKRAAAITGYAKDYIGQMCREGRIQAKLVGRSWYVLETSLRQHRFGTEDTETQEVADVPSVENVEAVEIPVETIVEETPVRHWESPTYVAEPVEELIPSRMPTYVENTEQKETAPKAENQIQEVQDAWQEWFSKNQTVAKENVVEIPEVLEEREQEAGEQEESVSDSVRITRNVAGAMDVIPSSVVQAEEETIFEEPVRRRTKQRRAQKTLRSPLPGRMVIQAVFLALMVLTIAVTVIGTGTLQVLNPTWVGASPVVDYLAGVKSIEK